MEESQESRETNPPEFSLVLGGPFYRLLVRTSLLRSPMELLPRRVVFVTALAWLPLLLLSIIDGRAIGGVSVPLLSDIETYARFLLAVPILLIAENASHSTLPLIIRQFRERGIVAGSEERFDVAIQTAVRRVNSTTAEVVMLALAVILGPWLWRNGVALHTDTWYADAKDEGISLTKAGIWFVHVSAPMFQFLLLRWYYRLAVWWWFLWKLSGLPLHLAAVHPDRSGGIGFLGDGSLAFMPVLFAQGAVASGLIASRVLFDGADALEFRGPIIVFLVCLLGSVLVPMLFFTRVLGLARRQGMRRYGWLAAAHSRAFERKWFSGSLPEAESPLGSPDMSSLADLAAAGDIVRDMRPIPTGLRTSLALAGAAALPFAPLVLTVIPLTELLQEAVKLLI